MVWVLVKKMKSGWGTHGVSISSTVDPHWTMAEVSWRGWSLEQTPTPTSVHNTLVCYDIIMLNIKHTYLLPLKWDDLGCSESKNVHLMIVQKITFCLHDRNLWQIVCKIKLQLCLYIHLQTSIRIRPPTKSPRDHVREPQQFKWY